MSPGMRGNRVSSIRIPTVKPYWLKPPRTTPRVMPGTLTHPAAPAPLLYTRGHPRGRRCPTTNDGVHRQVQDAPGTGARRRARSASDAHRGRRDVGDEGAPSPAVGVLQRAV